MDFKDVFNLIIPEEFGADEDNFDTVAIDKVYEQLDSTVKTAYGASQFTIIFKDDSHRVVKIPFAGSWYYNDDDDIYYFDKYDINYTNLSIAIYEKAIEAKVDPLFAKTEFIGYSKNGYPLYSQDKVDFTFCDTHVTKKKPYKMPSKETLTKVHNYSTTKNYSYAWRSFSEIWIGCAIEYYGIDLVSNFMNFLDENRIDDLHTGNYGFTSDGVPVIFDYCGFDC